jgi:hypothetical protein
MAYAQKLQKRLVETLVAEPMRQAFLNNMHAQHLQEMVRANASHQVKAKSPVGEAVQ